MMKNEDIQATALARLFSATVLKELAQRGQSPSAARLLRESGLEFDPTSMDWVGGLFDDAFDLLKQRVHRHEYIYKAALTQKVLLGTHSLKTASMITEFRVGDCKADVVILNGTGTVYEIKSERDSLARLDRQIEEYSRVFATVNVIVGENHLRAVEDILPDYVGIMVLSNRYQVSTLREALNDAERTESTAIFDAINQREAALILRDAGIDIPAVPNTQRFAVLRSLFAGLPAEVAHRGMVKVLKKTRDLRPLKSLIEEMPESLYAASLTVPLRQRDHSRLIGALHTPICEAVCWG